MLETVRKIRDEQRPKMEDVISTIDRLLEEMGSSTIGVVNFVKVLRGPETWTWMDASSAELGFERWFVVTGSTMEGTEGYPLFTIRSCMSPRLDSWVSVSQLVVGPDIKGIETSVTMAMINHQGAFEGLKQSITDLLKIMTGSATPMLPTETLASSGKKDLN